MRILLTSLAFLLAACNTAPVSTSHRLTVETSGGFTGRGVGSVSIDGADVNADARCRGTLSDAERDQLARLAATAHPDRWKSEYETPGHPDVVTYTLTLDGTKTTWQGEEPEGLPKEIAGLRAFAWDVRGRVLKGCV